MRKVSDDEFAAASKRSRAVKPSVFLEDVTEAAKHAGVVFAEDITEEGLSSKQIVHQLHKAGAQLDVKLKVMVRESATPPAVFFTVVK